MRELIQLIGQALAVQCPNATKALVYAEVQDGVIASSVFFETTDAQLFFRYPSDDLEDLVYEFWEAGADRVPARSWRALEYSVVKNKLAVDFTFPEQFNESEGHHERRPRVIARQFPGLKPNYSNPDGHQSIDA